MKAWNSTLNISRTSLRRSEMKKGTKRMNRIGPRGLQWLRVWRWLKPRLEAANRIRCEFGFIEHECGGFLTPAHSKKRRLMNGAEIYHVAICCSQFHHVLDERMSHEQMERTVMEAIERAGGLILPERY